MADTKISALNSLTKATVDTTDVIPVVDTGSSETKKMTYAELIQPQDNRFRIAGSSDNTKLVAFEVDGLTTATTRTLTVPDADLTLVGVDTTQTLAAKTLTSPQINFGSDATGDMIYRTGAGATARLPIGSTDQILAVSGGIPTWIANPSATAASTTTSGIVELATTAETTTGTDATRAVTPDGLHDMTSLAGAAWFLDEDTMSSDSDTKVASQQSIKAYVDTSISTATGDSVNTGTDTTYFTWTVNPVDIGWTLSSVTITDSAAGYSTFTASGAGSASATIMGHGSNTTFTAASSKIVKVRFRAKFASLTGRCGIGLVDSAADAYAIVTSTNDSVRFLNSAGTLYSVTAGTANENNDVDAGITDTNWNDYLIVFDPGTSAKFYINGTLVRTHSDTNDLPTGSLSTFSIGFETGDSMIMGPVHFTIEN